MGEVHKLDNARIPDMVSEKIVAECEKLLAQARAGEVTGLAYAAVGPNEFVHTNSLGEHGTKFAIGFGITMLSHDFYEGSR